MTDIEIPLQSEKTRRYRFFEILPGAITWSILILPFILSQFSARLTAVFVIAYLLLWFAKAVGLNVRALQGWRTMRQQQKLDWAQLLKELETGTIVNAHQKRPDWHVRNLRRLQSQMTVIKPSELVHAVIIATWNESREVLIPTLEAILNSHYDSKKVILVLAYEARGGAAVEAQAKELMEQYHKHFRHTMAVKHPDGRPNEMIGKGSNLTYAGRKLKSYVAEEGIDPAHVIVTTLDSDNRPHPWYLAALSYTYCVSPDPLHTSFQPVPMFTNNIWDAPAPMRVIATGNSFWMMVQALRPHMLRNFSAHAQGLQALIDTDFWSVRTIVEDGHQFWRTYFRYDGHHQVYPIFLPVYQDAVMVKGYIKTLRAQFIQLRRWAWGASDVAYVAEKGYFTENNISKIDLTFKFLRLLEGHISWATAPLILAFSAFIPLLFNSNDIAANQLPHIASRIQTIAMAGILVTLFLSFRNLPPKPKRYRAHRTFFMVIQWVYLPVTSIVYSSFAALNSQTRLMFGWYLGKFDLTEKAVVTKDKEVIGGL